MRRPPRGSADRIEALAVKLEALRQADSAAAVDLAIEIVGRERAHRAILPALEVLLEAHPPEARPALHARFFDLTENGVRFDQDCEIRVAIVKVLREIGAREDIDLAERGLRTVQLQPPGRIDVAQVLRGQCLLLLDAIDARRAGFFAVELLHDPHASTFNGQPAVTAIQILAARGEILPIWAVARRPGLPPDILAQAFASLRRAPADLQTDALRDHLTAALEAGESAEPTALVAAEAVVQNVLTPAYPLVFRLLRETTNRNLFLYLAVTAARSEDRALRELLQEYRRAEKDREKWAILEEALGKP